MPIRMNIPSLQERRKAYRLIFYNVICISVWFRCWYQPYLAKTSLLKSGNLNV
ncbi:hypothetical protein DPMN_015518 [Dreissena polymorpha]|uniref:Uncharacterized protein n=1 Tax=Dreissena polymorpha TaxID=45954 RepID=A0A9D4S5M5_DREPO|nr:hypothetical protein DPMN_015518 [Dreissena polymorpha]